MPEAINTSRGVPITPETIIELAPPMPDEVRQLFDPWLAEHADLLAELCKTPRPLSTHNEQYKQSLKILHKYGLRSLSKANYIIELPHMPYFLQICAPRNRFYNLLYQNGIRKPLRPPPNLSDSQLDRFKIVPTYKHISRVARYLRLAEYLEHTECTRIKTVPTYLVHIPGQPKECTDENYVVVQEKALDVEQITKKIKRCDEKERQALLNRIFCNQALHELFGAIQYAALWDLAYYNLLIDTDNHIIIADLEQQNASRANSFYYKRTNEHHRDVRHGLEKIEEFLKKYAPSNAWRPLRTWQTLCKKYIK